MTGMLRFFLIAVCGLWLACTAAAAAAQSAHVRQAQERLDALGLAPGPIDGLMGNQTRDALRIFQRKSAIPATGELDWQTQTALSATVRTTREAKPVPVPRAVPVPTVLVSSLPAPGTGKVGVAEADRRLAMAEAGPATRPEAPAVERLATTTGATAGPDASVGREVAPDATVASDGNSDTLRGGLVVGLGLVAAGAGLVLQRWLRWWSQPAKPAAEK